MRSRPEKGLPGHAGQPDGLACICPRDNIRTWALWCVCGGGRGGQHEKMQRNARPDLALHLSNLLPMTTPFGAGRGGGREEVVGEEEGVSHAGLGRVLAEVGSLPTPSRLRRPRIMALVPGATLLLRLCLWALVLRLQNVPSLRFSNLDRPGCLGKEGFFHGGSQGPGIG